MREEIRPSSQRKREAILAAAEDLFLRDGYADANMDELATCSGVSKQTIYAHFGSKEALFVELVSAMTSAAGDGLHEQRPDPTTAAELPEVLAKLGEDQLSIVLQPRLLRLRRLVIGEVGRFPDLAKVLWERGPNRAIVGFAELFDRLDRAGLLYTGDPLAAARHFNWLVMGAPINDAMLLGDRSVPRPAARRAHVAEAVRIFLAAYPADRA